MKKNINQIQPLFALQDEVLARELSMGLEDMINLKFYQSITKKYPERVLKDIYDHVRQIPQCQIKKSKGALFNYLLQQHGQNNHRN